VVSNHYLDAARIKIWNNTTYKIPLASHLVNIDASGKFNKFIAAYAKDVFSNNAV